MFPFFKKLILSMCVYQQKFSSQRRQIPRTWIASSCELPDVGLDLELKTLEEQ